MEFFEEIEDLKYNYQQVTEENERLRERVRRLRGRVKFVFSPEKSLK